MSLQHWDYYDSFTVHDAARLIAGFDPGLGHIEDRATAAKVAFIEEQICTAVQNGLHRVMNFFGDDWDKLGDAAPYTDIGSGSIPALAVTYMLSALQLARDKVADAKDDATRQRVHESFTNILDRHYTAIERMCDSDRDVPINTSKIRISRESIALWSACARIESAYKFDSNGTPENGRQSPPGTGDDSLTTFAAPRSLAAESSPRKDNNMAALLAAMAIDKYGYQPGASRSEVPGDLAVLLRTFGYVVSDQTIRRFLREGTGLLTLRKGGWPARSIEN